MGEVWSGYDIRLDRPVAVKLLHPNSVPSGAEPETLAKRFAREARLTARVEHPGVPAIFDAGVDGEQLYLVMQLVPGIDLINLLAQHQPLPVEWGVAVAAQIASVLSVAHAASLVHRDLKPSNVMVRPDGTVVVLDFGVAALLAPDVTQLTGPGETIGSPAYMSPEQVIGGVPSPRSDLYSLGCMLYELLTDARPFSADATFLIMRQHVDEPAPQVRSVRPEVPVDLERLVLDLMAKEPEDRPVDAQEVHERLLPFLPGVGSGGLTSMSDPTRPYRYPLAPRRRRTAPRSVEAAATAPVDFAVVRDEAADLAMAGRFTQAADLLTGLLGGGSRGRSRPEVRGARLQLANTLLLGGDYARALAEYERLVSEIGPERALDDVDVLDWKIQIATCHAALGNAQDALQYLEPVLETKRRQLGHTDDEVVELRRQVAMLHASAGDTARAREEVRALLADLDPSHPASSELGQVLIKLKQD